MNKITPDLKEIFDKSKVIAIIGCSPNMYRTSNYIAKFMMEKGFTIIPVNPKEDQIFGLKCYPSLNDIPESENVDIVNVFRDSEYTLGVVEEVIEFKERTGQSPTIWTQLNVSTDKAKELASQNELPYVENKCIMVEWERRHN